MSELETIDVSQLDNVTGGATDAKIDISGDASQTIRDVGNGVKRVIGCAFGASSGREFGNCMLTGHLGGVPQGPQSPAGR